MRTLRALVIVAPLAVLAGVVGETIGFGGVAWLATLVALMFLTSLVDREWFYGEPHPFSRRSHPR